MTCEFLPFLFCRVSFVLESRSYFYSLYIQTFFYFLYHPQYLVCPLYPHFLFVRFIWLILDVIAFIQLHRRRLIINLGYFLLIHRFLFIRFCVPYLPMSFYFNGYPTYSFRIHCRRHSINRRHSGCFSIKRGHRGCLLINHLFPTASMMPSEVYFLVAFWVSATNGGARIPIRS